MIKPFQLFPQVIEVWPEVWVYGPTLHHQLIDVTEPLSLVRVPPLGQGTSQPLVVIEVFPVLVSQLTLTPCCQCSWTGLDLLLILSLYSWFLTPGYGSAPADNNLIGRQTETVLTLTETNNLPHEDTERPNVALVGEVFIYEGLRSGPSLMDQNEMFYVELENVLRIEESDKYEKVPKFKPK